MSKFKLLKKFRDKETKEVYDPKTQEEIELTEERAEEVIANLGDGFIEAIEKVNNEEFPKHIGGGNFELSNGDKVKTKEAAIAAEQALKE